MNDGRTEWNVRTFGAKADGRTDDTAAVQSAISACAEAGGGTVFLPTGTYRIDGTLSVGPNVSLTGAGGSINGNGEPTTLHAFNDTAPFITLETGAGVKFLAIYYPEQRLVPGQVKPYPWTITAGQAESHVIGVALRNSYDGIRLDNAAQHLVRDIHGSPLHTGIYVDRIYDIGRIENVHFWPFMGPEANRDFYFEYMPHIATGFVFGRTDWQYVYNTFTWGYKIAYHFIETAHGSCNGNFLGIGGDACEQCVVIEAAQPYTGGILITNGEFVPLFGDECKAIVVTESFKGYASFMNCGVWGPSDQIAEIRGDGRINISQCNFIQWDKNKRNAAAIEVFGGQATIQGNHFDKPKNRDMTAPEVAIRQGTKSAVVLGNVCEGPWRAINEIGEQGQVGFNVGSSPA